MNNWELVQIIFDNGSNTYIEMSEDLRKDLKGIAENQRVLIIG